ncbi:MAG: hypothetical protein CMJ59_10920 [Planctomycetaceae bacterium]|nr:hypothetical protein [Planctomycetaceae bacterium]
MADQEIKETGAVQIDIEISVDKPRDAVWKSIVEETASWWPADFWATKTHRRMVFEPKPGGRLYEEAEGGGGLLWYTVIAIEPPESLHLAGYIAPPFGGPATSLLRIALTAPSGSTTLLKISDSVFGCVDGHTKQSVAEGWSALFAAAKRYIEKK